VAESAVSARTVLRPSTGERESSYTGQPDRSQG